MNAHCVEALKMLVIPRGDSLAAQFRFAERGQIKVTFSNALLDGRAVNLAQIKALGDGPSAAASNIVVTPSDLCGPSSIERERKLDRGSIGQESITTMSKTLTKKSRN